MRSQIDLKRRYLPANTLLQYLIWLLSFTWQPLTFTAYILTQIYVRSTCYIFKIGLFLEL